MTSLAEVEGTAAPNLPTEAVSGGEAVYWALRALGVECVFGISSIHNLPIFEAIDRVGGVAHVSSRHEQAATHAADGYARATGKLGVVIASTGPGTTNTATGLLEAAFSSSPVARDRRPGLVVGARQRQGLPARVRAPARLLAHAGPSRRLGTVPAGDPTCAVAYRAQHPGRPSPTGGGADPHRFPPRQSGRAGQQLRAHGPRLPHSEDR